MKQYRQIMVAVLMLMTGLVMAEPSAKEPPVRHGRMLNRRNWVGKRVLSSDFQKQVGIESEQAQQIKAQLEPLAVEAQRLEDAITREAQQQAELAKQVLNQPGASAEEIMAIIERIGQYRTDQAKLATRQLIVIRDLLTEEQRSKAREILTNEAQRRMTSRALGNAKQAE